MNFTKYQALGNDYLVIEPDQAPGGLSEAFIRRLCDRHYGAGADGILYGPLPSQLALCALRIYNPDGSSAEKSGNGLRIFARHLWESRHVQVNQPFQVETLGGKVNCIVEQGGSMVTVEMGRASFESQDIPLHGPPRAVIGETMEIDGQLLTYCAVSFGNPHCTVLRSQVCEEEARHLGALIEIEPRFPKRTNVHFLQVLDEHSLRIEIWERGAGYTLASGSSACAAAASGRRLGLSGQAVTVHMPGGKLEVWLSEDWQATLRGPVEKVYQAEITWENESSP